MKTVAFFYHIKVFFCVDMARKVINKIFLFPHMINEMQGHYGYAPKIRRYLQYYVNTSPDLGWIYIYLQFR